MKKVGYFVVAIALIALIATCNGNSVFAKASKQPQPTITITSVPTDYPSESMASRPIAGTVKNAPKGSVVVVYALGDTWYVQPWASNPYTSIENGKWSTDTHGGFAFVALLVKPGYQPSATLSGLPKVGGSILAMAKATPKKK